MSATDKTSGEKLARRMAETAGRSMVNLGPYKTCDDAAEKALFPFATLLVQMGAALKKASPGIGELHAQGIGCPDCDHDSMIGTAPCAFERQIDRALSAYEALMRDAQ